MLNIKKSNFQVYSLYLVYHFFHLVSPFLWPFIIFISLFILTSSKVLSMHAFFYSCLECLTLVTFLTSIIYIVYLLISSLKKEVCTYVLLNLKMYLCIRFPFALFFSVLGLNIIFFYILNITSVLLTQFMHSKIHNDDRINNLKQIFVFILVYFIVQIVILYILRDYYKIIITLLLIPISEFLDIIVHNLFSKNIFNILSMAIGYQSSVTKTKLNEVKLIVLNFVVNFNSNPNTGPSSGNNNNPGSGPGNNPNPSNNSNILPDPNSSRDRNDSNHRGIFSRLNSSWLDSMALRDMKRVWDSALPYGQDMLPKSAWERIERPGVGAWKTLGIWWVDRPRVGLTFHFNTGSTNNSSVVSTNNPNVVSTSDPMSINRLINSTNSTN